MDSENNALEVPKSIENFLVVEDCSNFPIERYVLTAAESQIAKDILKMRKVVPRLKEMNIDYLNATLLYGAPGTGKAQPLTSKVLTEYGYKTIKDIEIGDKVVTPEGELAPVMGIYPQGVKQVFKVTMFDGASCRCTADHLWEVRGPSERLSDPEYNKRGRVITLKDMMSELEEEGHFSIPVAVAYEGTRNEYAISHTEYGKMAASGNSINDSTYLVGKRGHREEFIKALMRDSPAGKIQLRDEETAKFVSEMAWSVGYECILDKTDVEIRPYAKGGIRERFIKSIVPDGEEECRCIYINDPRHLYLTDGLIATHNTTFGRYMAYKMGLNFAFMQFANILSGGMGDTSKNITAVFNFIKDKNCIFMMDEIDAISAKRGFGEAASGGELGRITITVMQELDKLKKRGSKAIIVAATNINTSLMDEALVSRFPIVREVRTWTNSEKVAYIHKFLSSTGLPENDDEITAYVSAHSSLNQRGIEADLIRAAAEWIANGMKEFKIEHIKEKV